ncbi:MAG TPA: SRPBCC family protein [Fibrobacteria bacterium]|nr:SRPBCC family protein [Fibrobacteria bacterium]
MDSSEFAGEGTPGQTSYYGYGLPSASGQGSGRNVGTLERIASVAAGGTLLYFGIGKLYGKTYTFKKVGWSGVLLALGGVNLLLRGTLGKSIIYKAFGFSTANVVKASKGAIHVEKSATVDRSADEIYRFWRNFENLPRIMDHLKAVRTIDERRSHWVAKGPAGMEVEWDAEITEDLEGRRIAWRSLEGSDVFTQGHVTFDPAPDGRGTEVRISLEYQPPGGKAGAALAKLFGEEPNQQIDEDLRRFKRMLETGEIAHGQYARG